MEKEQLQLAVDAQVKEERRNSNDANGKRKAAEQHLMLSNQKIKALEAELQVESVKQQQLHQLYQHSQEEVRLTYLFSVNVHTLV